MWNVLASCVALSFGEIPQRSIAATLLVDCTHCMLTLIYIYLHDFTPLLLPWTRYITSVVVATIISVYLILNSTKVHANAIFHLRGHKGHGGDECLFYYLPSG